MSDEEIPIWQRDTPLRLRNRWDGVAGVVFPDNAPPTSVTLKQAMELLQESEEKTRELLAPLSRAHMILGGRFRKVWYKEDVMELKRARDRAKKAQKNQRKQKKQKKTCLARKNKV